MPKSEKLFEMLRYINEYPVRGELPALVSMMDGWPAAGANVSRRIHAARANWSVTAKREVFPSST